MGEKHRIKSARMLGYDYSSNGAYFITIVTKKRQHFFGSGKMILNKIGKIVWNEWFVSEQIRDNIILDNFVIMLNRIHGIVIIVNTTVETLHLNVSTSPTTTQLYRNSYPRISATFLPISAGDSTTKTPFSLKILILASAVSSAPPTIAPACPIVLPLGAV